MSMTEQEQRLAASLHESIFWKEFTFSRNDFKPQGSTEVQFADGVVLTGDTLILYQMKNREPTRIGTQVAEGKWFKNAIESDARDQIKRSVSYLQSMPSVKLTNHRGDVFNLTACAANEILKVIIYANSGPLPEDCRRMRHIPSKSAGFIHVLEESDYTFLVNTLRVPFEIVEYLRYREFLLTRGDWEPTVTERALLGHFVAESEGPPRVDSAAHLNRLRRDQEHWDLTPVLGKLRDQLLNAGQNTAYYPVLRAFARLSISVWRECRTGIAKCARQAGTSPCLRRLIDPRSKTAVIMVDDTLLRCASGYRDLQELQAFRLLVADFKYISRTDYCIGLLFRSLERETDIGWACLEERWMFDPMREAATSDSWLGNKLCGVQGSGFQFSDSE